MWHYRIKTYLPPAVMKTLGDLSDVEHMVAAAAKQDADPRVPARTGALAAAARVEENRVIYPGPSAAPLYFGHRGDVKLHMSTAVHPRAQTFWFWAAKKDNLPKWRRQAAREIIRKFKR